ncbi:MAG: hypothetical protein KGP28_12030 [Bdellovibrionales bacterium]|nr:hypothetical protein [Bdellovibrionales bacterium]
MASRLWINGFPGIVFLGAFLFAAEKLLFHLDLLNIDVAGHFASAMSSHQGQFHRFNDQFFAGYIHGLFYPPLEDWILSSWFKLTSLVSIDPYQSFSFYLCAIFGAYLFSQWRFVMAFRPGLRRNFLASILVFLDLVAKSGEISLQGLSLYDFWSTGLTSQVLSGVFFFWFLGSILQERPLVGSIAAFSLTFLSHIVMGLSAALILVFIFVFQRNRRCEILMIALWSAGISAFFWVPFLAHRDFLENTNVFSGERPCWSFAAFSLGLLILQKRSALDRALLGFSLLIFLCQGLLPLLIKWSPLGVQQWAPAFHYYRLGVVGVLVLGVVVTRIEFRIARIAMPAFLLCLGLNFNNFSYGEVQSRSSPVLDLRESGDLSFDRFGRYWVVGQRRTIDFGLDTLLASELSDFRSNKGLYWESSKSNTLLSSYLTTLLKAPSILQYFFFANYPCHVLGCVLDSYFRTFNIRGVIGDPMHTSYGLPSSQVECYREVFRKGTPLHQIEKTGLIRPEKKFVVQLNV